jgi:hypothetical protein
MRDSLCAAIDKSGPRFGVKAGARRVRAQRRQGLASGSLLAVIGRHGSGLRGGVQIGSVLGPRRKSRWAGLVDWSEAKVCSSPFCFLF